MRTHIYLILALWIFLFYLQPNPRHFYLLKQREYSINDFSDKIMQSWSYDLFYMLKILKGILALWLASQGKAVAVHLQ